MFIVFSNDTTQILQQKYRPPLSYLFLPHSVSCTLVLALIEILLKLANKEGRWSITLPSNPIYIFIMATQVYFPTPHIVLSSVSPVSVVTYFPDNCYSDMDEKSQSNFQTFKKCIGVLLECRSGHYFHAWCLQTIRGIRSHWMGGTDGDEVPCECWELNLGSLEEQPVLSTTETSLQPLNPTLIPISEG